MNGTIKILKELLNDYTQEELARQLGVTLRSVQNYLTGTVPRREVVRKIQELKNGKPPESIVHHDALGLITGRMIQVEAMQRVQLTVLQELFAKALNIPNMEAKATIDRALGQELQKLKEEFQHVTS